MADFVGSSALVEPGLVLITEHCVVNPDDSTGRFAGAQGTVTDNLLIGPSDYDTWTINAPVR